MKNNPILNLSKIVMMVALIILQISCQQTDSYNPPADSAHIKLSVSAYNSGTTVSTDDPASSIQSLCILQFNTIGTNFGTLRHVGIGEETSPNSGKYSATLLQSNHDTDLYKLVILANFPDGYGIFQGMVGKTYDAIRKMCLSEELTGNTNVPAFDSGRPFPMFGVAKDGVPVFINETMDLGSVSLVRAVARVDIGIGTKNSNNDTWNKNGVPFFMTQIQIWKAGKQYAYMPAEGNFSLTADTLTINRPSPVGNTDTKMYGETYITDGTYCAEKIYLPEADLQWGGVYDDLHTQRLAIIVGGKYNNSEKVTYYRVDFTYDDGSQQKMNILRNHVYQFTIKSVDAAGYDTPKLAYDSKPKNLGFEVVALEQWTAGQTASVPSISGYYLTYLGFNGENVDWTYDVGSSIEIPKKKSFWGTNARRPFDYNDFYKEGNSWYADTNIGNGQNGRLYPTVEDAFFYEGTYPNLMVSANDVVDESGSEQIAWKTETTLTAFDLCRDLEENGFDDWRLPRLSELAFIYANQAKLELFRGFTPLSGIYWCGSEYMPQNATEDQQKKSDSAWAVDFSANTGYALWCQKTEKLKIRCVRQSSN